MERKIGIITRTKNRNILLRRAIESVLGQSYQNWIQVIVNDGGSSTEVEDLVSNFQERARGRIKVIHHEASAGMEAASNAGIESIIADVDLIIIHDDDDSWAPEFLKISALELESAQSRMLSIKGVITQANCVYESINGNCVTTTDIEPFLPWINQGLISLDAMLHQCQFAPIQFLFCKEAIKEIGLYREDLPVLGDWEFNIRFLKKFDIMIIPQYLAFYHHRQGINGIYSNSVHGARDRHDLFRQWLKNQWLRDDLNKGITGLGNLANSRPHIEHIVLQLDRIFERLNVIEAHKSQPFGSGSSIFSIGRLLHQSGRPLHYLKRFALFLRTQGVRETVARTRLWIQLKSRQ